MAELYFIKAVSYKDNKYIDQVKVAKDNGDKTHKNLGEFNREWIVEKIKNKIPVKTLIPKDNNEKNYDIGADVILDPTNGIDFIKTKANDKEEDNLEELPKF